jgi:hypothetical protein
MACDCFVMPQFGADASVQRTLEPAGIHIYRDAPLKYTQPFLTNNRLGYPFFLRATFHLLLYTRYRAQGAWLTFESTGGQPPLESWR